MFLTNNCSVGFPGSQVPSSSGCSLAASGGIDKAPSPKVFTLLQLNDITPRNLGLLCSFYCLKAFSNSISRYMFEYPLQMGVLLYHPMPRGTSGVAGRIVRYRLVQGTREMMPTIRICQNAAAPLAPYIVIAGKNSANSEF